MTERNETIRLTVLGARGSLPVSGGAFREFGGATSCYRLEAAGQAVLLDAGTGILDAGDQVPAAILLSHTHLDHIAGLPMFAPLSRPGGELHIYGRTRDGLSPEKQLGRLFAPPLWPCGLGDYPARVLCHELAPSQDIGPFRVDVMEGSHPGGCAVFRLRRGEKAVVYATDFEHTEQALSHLADFARDADLLLYDGQYAPGEYETKRGYGHSTAEMGLRVQRDSGAKRLLLIHHDPRRTDSELRTRERLLDGARAHYARQGEVIEL